MFDDTYPDKIPIFIRANSVTSSYLAWKGTTGAPEVTGFIYKFELSQETAVGGGNGSNTKGKPVKGIIGYVI